MSYEVIEQGEEWIVRRQGVELSRFRRQDEALSDIAHRLREAGPFNEMVSLAVRYANRP